MYNEWSEWSDCLDGAGEIAYCDGGTYSRSRLCIDIDGVTPTGSENCDPPDTVEEIDVPCNTDACPGNVITVRRSTSRASTSCTEWDVHYSCC